MRNTTHWQKILSKEFFERDCFHSIYRDISLSGNYVLWLWLCCCCSIVFRNNWWPLKFILTIEGKTKNNWKSFDKHDYQFDSLKFITHVDANRSNVLPKFTIGVQQNELQTVQNEMGTIRSKAIYINIRSRSVRMPYRRAHGYVARHNNHFSCILLFEFRNSIVAMRFSIYLHWVHLNLVFTVMSMWRNLFTDLHTDILHYAHRWRRQNVRSDKIYRCYE